MIDTNYQRDLAVLVSCQKLVRVMTHLIALVNARGIQSWVLAHSSVLLNMRSLVHCFRKMLILLGERDPPTHREKVMKFSDSIIFHPFHIF